MAKTYEQNDSHDWLGDAAEAYVRYCFASEGFEVFGSGKWAADAAVHDLKSDKWWRVAVKSTDHPKKQVGGRGLNTLIDKVSEKAELFAQVRIVRGMPIELRLIKLRGSKRGERCLIGAEGDIKKFLRE